MTNAEFAQGLREVAAFYEAHPEMPQPIGGLHVTVWTKEELASAARQLAHGGRVAKYDRGKDSLAKVCVGRDFNGVRVEVAAYKDNLGCRKVKKMVEVEAWECPESLLEGVEASANGN